MRVLLITDWPRYEGGVETYATWLRRALQDAGDTVRLLTSSAGSAATGTADYVTLGTDHPAAQAFLQIINPFAVRSVRTALHRLRPDVVHVLMFMQHLSPAILWALRDVPTVLSIADYKYLCPTNSKLLPDATLCTRRAGAICRQQGCVSLAHWLRDQPRYGLIRLWPARVGRVLVCSRWIQDAMAAEGVASEELPLPTPAPERSFTRTPADHPLFVYCGRLAREKGLEGLLRAFARIHRSFPQAKLRVVGAGPLRARLADLASGLDLAAAVTFVGWLPSAQVERELAPAWAVVAPSLWAEPLGLSAIEAIVRGVPVIASHAGGFCETVDPGSTGLLFPNGDESVLAECLTAVAGGRAFPSHAVDADAAQRLADRHAPERHLQRLREIYRSLQAHATAM